MPGRSSHPLLSYADGFASNMADVLLLVGRVLIAAMFLLTVWFGSPTAQYLASINYVAPDLLGLLARITEWIIVFSLVFGIGTRYGASLGLLFVIVATVTAHRWWGYPQAAQLVQYTFLVKNLAAAGGLVLLFVMGGGRLSVDQRLSH